LGRGLFDKPSCRKLTLPPADLDLQDGTHPDICLTMPTATTQVLILADDKPLEEVLTETLAECGINNVSTSVLDNSELRIENEHPDLILADLDSPSADSPDWIANLRKSDFAGRIVVLAGTNSIFRVREALDKGASGYLRKPVEAWEVELAVRDVRNLPERSREKAEDISTQVYGSSPEIQSVLKIVDQVAHREDPLTLLGEVGSGKRLIGRMIHSSSPRKRAPFMNLSCSGLSESVIDRELFGYPDPHDGTAGEGHFGCLQLCEGGTLLLDEIGNMPRRTQEKLLKCMTRKTLQHAGMRPGNFDVRIIATSSQDLEEKVRAGRFHREFFDRLQSIQIPLPALRKHRSDIPILVDRFVRHGARIEGKVLNGISPSALARLMQYDWPGNVRELKDMIRHAVAEAEGSVLGNNDLPSLPEPIGSGPNVMVLGSTIQEVEKEAILRTLEAAGGSTSRAAKILEMSVRKIQYKLKEYRHEAASAVRLETVRSVSPTPSPLSKKTVPLKKPIFASPSDRPE
jgi:DNA-binding NtrC family response regulator